MTVVLGIRCADGVVLASDSQVTESDRDMSYPDRKLHPLGDTAAWGGSGARSVIHDVREVLAAEADEVLGSQDVGRALQERVVPALRHHYDLFIRDVPGQETSGTPAAYVLAGGYTRGEPFLVKIDPAGLVSRYEDVGFHAIGSGAPMAQQAAALLAHFDLDQRDLAHGVVAAVRVVDTLSVSQPQVGGPLNVYRLTPDGSHLLDEDEVAEVRQVVRRWEQADREAFDAIFE
jgi:proteasome beta subunit